MTWFYFLRLSVILMIIHIQLVFSDKDLASLQIKRNGELLRETTSDSLSNLRAEGEPLVENKQQWPGEI